MAQKFVLENGCLIDSKQGEEPRTSRGFEEFWEYTRVHRRKLPRKSASFDM